LTTPTTGTHSKDQTYILNFKSGADTLSANVVIHLDGRDEIEFGDIDAGNNVFVGDDKLRNKFFNPGNDVLYLRDSLASADAMNGSDVIYGGNGGGGYWFSTNDSVIFGGDGRDTVFFLENSDNGLFFGGSGNDFIIFDPMEEPPKNSYSWGGGDSDLFLTFTKTTEQSKNWIMDFNFSPTDQGGDEILFYKDFNVHKWDQAKTQLVPHTADAYHPYLSEGAQYYELKVQSSIDENDTNWYSVFNLVGTNGTEITFDGLIANRNLVEYIIS
jgi:hypothetical protein